MISQLSQKALDKSRIVQVVTNLFDVVKEAVFVGEGKMGFSQAKIRGFTLFWKMEESDGYVAFDSLVRRAYLADSNFDEIEGESEIGLDFYIILRETLLDCLTQSSTGVNNLFPRLGRAVRSRLYSLRNRFPVKMKIYQGYPLSEVDFFLDNRLMLAAKRAIKAGNQRLKLKASKVIGDRLFLNAGEDVGYLVLYPNGHYLGRPSVFYSKTLDIKDCIPEASGTTLQEESKRKFIKDIESWLDEAGIGSNIQIKKI